MTLAPGSAVAVTRPITQSGFVPDGNNDSTSAVLLVRSALIVNPDGAGGGCSPPPGIGVGV